MLIYDDKIPKMVWRIEDEEGAGPYCRKNKYGYFNGKTRSAVIWEVLYNVYKHQPAPERDFSKNELLLLNGDLRYRFGFLYKKDAIKWFGEAGIKQLESFGYKLIKRKANKIWLSISGSQVIFK